MLLVSGCVVVVVVVVVSLNNANANSFLKRVSILSETTHAAVLPDDRVDDFEGYGGDDIENTIRDLLSGEVDKRGFRCRPGYTYQSILRDCVPSLGVSTSYPSNNLIAFVGLEPVTPLQC